MKQRAHLLEPPKFDISQLYREYEVSMIFDNSEDVRGYVAHPDALYETVRCWAEGYFKPETDLFVLTGNQTLLVACSLAIASAHPEEDIKFLRFDAHTQTYVETVFYGRRASAGKRTDERGEISRLAKLSSDSADSP